MSVYSLDEWRKKLADTSDSTSQSTQNTASDSTGPKPTEEEFEYLLAIYKVLLKARQSPFTTKSDFARYAANEVALCASEGLITTHLEEHTYTNTWMVTADGMAWMEGFSDVFSPRH